MLGSLTSLIAAEPYGALEALGVPTRTGQFVPRLAPFGVFPTTDGWVAICGPLDKFAHRLLSLLDDAGKPLRTEYASRDARVEHAVELHEEISAWTSTRTTGDAVADLDAAGVPAGPVRHPIDAVRDPRVLRRNEVVDLGDSSPAARGIYGPGLPFLISGMDLRLDQAAPPLGADSEKILSSLLGFEPDRIDELKRTGVL
jgi:crotonobetainyl-CoA:carnitine CoA-transferase CaiB-like acyl-CoA transferase